MSYRIGALVVGLVLALALVRPAEATQTITFNTLTDGQVVQRNARTNVEVTITDDTGSLAGAVVTVDGAVIITFGAGPYPTRGGGSWDVPAKPNAPHTITVTTATQSASITVYASAP